MKKTIIFILILFGTNCYAQTSSITIKLYIEGLMNGIGQSNGVSNLISPLSNDASFNNVLACDSIQISIYDTNNLNVAVAQQKSLLLINGLASFTFNNQFEGNYYWISIKGRNILETWSKNSILFYENTYYNFTTINNFPIVNTINVNNITPTNASVEAAVINDGGDSVTQRGLCWSLQPNPSINSLGTSINGIGVGSFSALIGGLVGNTDYYVRAYAINSVGIAYGKELKFRTSKYPPIDVDGNVYDTIRIGNQVWMQENLMVKHYRNGDLINSSLSNLNWQNTTSGAFSVFDNDSTNESIYGLLYNFYAVANPNGLCPIGWHVPSNSEWDILESNLGGNNLAGGKLKQVGTLNWSFPNYGATNASSFNGLGGGMRYESGYFYDKNDYGYWWSSTAFSFYTAWMRQLNYDDDNLNSSNLIKANGFSVRCIED